MDESPSTDAPQGGGNRLLSAVPERASTYRSGKIVEFNVKVWCLCSRNFY
jgi:hypothetical protein